MHRDFISKNLCENKNRPEIKCNGKCYLNKKIKSQEKTEQQIPSILKGLDELVIHCSSFCFGMTPPVSILEVQVVIYYVMKNYPAPAFSFFQPPRL
jgi:hypothetical protein